MSSPSLGQLVLEWEKSLDRGRDLSPEELASGSPGLVAPLREVVEAMRRARRLAVTEELEAATLPPGPADDAATVPPLPSDGRAPGPAHSPPGYELLGELGRGGMGVVYRARQLGLNRIVALKMILGGGHAGEEGRARFLAEAEAIAKIRHPGIVQVHGFGTHDGLPYFSLEMCEGGSLADRLREGPLPPREAAELVEKVARAVQAAHEAGIVHRDLKPANVLLTEKGEPRVTDFGLARKGDGEGLTQTGAVMGTPSYMAPEQAEGKKDVGPAADVWALGAVLYACLTGRPPFQAATSLDTILQVVADEPPPLRQLRPGVPRDLETICHKCLQKGPQRRYASAGELADDLRRWLDGEFIRARRPSILEVFWNWAVRYPGLTLLRPIAWPLVACGMAALAVQALLVPDVLWKSLIVAGGAFVVCAAGVIALAQSYALRGALYDTWLCATAGCLLGCLYVDRAGSGALGYVVIAALVLAFLAGAVGSLASRQEPSRAEGWPPGRTSLLQVLLAFILVVLPGGWLADQSGVRIFLVGLVFAAAASLGYLQARTVRSRGPSLGGWALVATPVLVALGWLVCRLAWPSSGLVPGFPTSLFGPEGADPVVLAAMMAAGALAVLLAGAPEAEAPGGSGEGGKAPNQGKWPLRTWAGVAVLSALVVGLIFGGKLTAHVMIAAGGVALVIVATAVACRVLEVPYVPITVFGLLWAQHAWQHNNDITRPASPGRPSAWGQNQTPPAASPHGQPFRPGEAQHSTRKVSVFLRSEYLANATCVASGPGHSLIAMGNAEGAVQVWSGGPGQKPLVLEAHAGEVLALAFHPGGKHLATGGQDGMVRLWGLPTGNEELAINCRPGEARAIAFSADGNRLVIAGGVAESKTARPLGWLRVCDPETGRQLFAVEALARPLACVAFSPEGKRIIAAGEDQMIRGWDAASGRDLFSLEGHAGGTTCVAFAPDGKRFASGGMDGAARLWDAATGKQQAVLQGHKAPVLSLAYRVDGKRLATGGGPAVSVFDTSKGQFLERQEGFGLISGPPGSRGAGHPGHADFRPAMGSVAVLAYGHPDQVTAVRFDLRVSTPQPAELLSLAGHGRWAGGVAWSADGKSVCSTGGDGKLKAWDARTGQCLFAAEGAEGPVAFSPDGKLIASGGPGLTMRLWDAATGKPRLTAGAACAHLAFSPDGGRIATGGGRYDARTKRTVGEWKVWDAQSGKELVTGGHLAYPVAGLAYSPDGKHILTGGLDQAVHAWGAESGKLLFTLRGHTGCVNSVAYSPDGKAIVSGSDDGTVRVWDARDKKPRHTIQGWLGRVNGVAFSPGGERIIGGGAGLTVWHAASGLKAWHARGHRGAVRGVAYSPDGKRVASAGDDGAVKIWEVGR